MANLTGQNIKDTYQQLVTLGSGTTITNGTGSQITDLAVTSSWASNAVTASYALNAGVTVDTGSLMVTGSVSGNVLTFTKGDGSAFNLTVATGSAVTVSTASLMVTASAAANIITFTKGDGSTFNVTVSQSGSVASASYATFAANAGALDGTPASGYARLIANNTFTGTTQTFTDIVSNGTASLTRIQAIGSELFVDDKVVITSGDLNVQSGNVLVSNGSLTVLGGNISGSFVGSLTGNASTATSASHALNADRLGAQLPSHYATATSVSSLSSSLSTRLTTDESNIASLTAATSSYALKTEVSGAFNNVSSSFASRLTTDEAIITSLVAATGSYAKTNVNNSFTGLQTFNNIAVNGTASIGYLESVTGSAKIIGDAYIILNNDTPAQRYAGIKVIDSGSANVTASLLFDGQTNDWFYEYESGDPTDFGVFLVGPEYGTIGSPIYPTANQIQKGTGTHHLTGSNITDDDTKVSIAIPLEVTGNISTVSGAVIAAAFTGSLNGNADTATSASFATYANTAGTATSATSASYATFALSASYAPHTEGLIQGNSGDLGSLRSFIPGGASSVASGSDAVSIGNSATANGYQAVALGASANAPEFSATALGGNSKAEATLAVAIGSGATIRAYGGIGVGASTEAEGGQFGVAIGQAAKAYGQNTVALGAYAVTAYPEPGQIVIGRSTSTGANEIIIGSGSTSYGANTVHIGNASITDTYLEGVIHGNGASVTGVVSASYALTASYAQNAGASFPYTGAAVISGSLNISGSVGASNVVMNNTDTFTSSPKIQEIVTCTQAEYNTVSGSANASQTLYIITDATGGGQYVSGSLTSNVNALTITSNTASMDCQAGNFFTLTLGASANTFVNPTNIQAGQTINLRITQPTPNTGSISFGASVKQVSGSAYSPTALASAVDIVTFVAFDTSSLYLANLKKFV